MKLQQLIDSIHPAGSPKRPTPEQEKILAHGIGPAWILAGPGSGKTEVLTLLALRLMYVSGDSMQAQRIPAESIFLTTFTDKAARNLQDRISRYRERLIKADPSLASIDVSKLRVGTLHGLANDLLQEARAKEYRNVRLMDQLETAMFVHENMSIIRKQDKVADLGFWSQFEFMFSPFAWKRTMKRLPLQWDMALTLIKLFNRICEDRKDLNMMRKAGGAIARLVDLYEEYRQHLRDHHRCDFSQLQDRFLTFLASPEGKKLRDGVDAVGPGITHVLVDEYQDTNLVQEAIYFELAKREPHNLVIVGDDDQAMYRFRGGSVECMVTFDTACAQFLNVNSIALYPLVGNFRSHKSIVEFCNAYVDAFPAMKKPGARVAGKPPLVPKSSIQGNYLAAGILTGSTLAEVANRFADALADLKAKGVIADYNQACLLLASTRESPHYAGPFANALRARGIPVYNPRSRTFLEQDEVAGLLGCLLMILDPDDVHRPSWAPNEVPGEVANFRAAAQTLIAAHTKLAKYITQARKDVAKNAGEYLGSTLQEIVYYLLAHAPFDQYMSVHASRLRLAQLTSLVESFASIPVQGFPNVFRGNLSANPDGSGSVKPQWLRTFYDSFVGYIAKGGINDLEDDEVIAPSGMVPIMTMHQAKGLEFPFVFVGHLSKNAEVDATHRLEDLFAVFPNNSSRTFPILSAADRAELDKVRQYYVAYSRAENALVLLGTRAQIRGGATPCGPSRTWLQQHLLEY